MITNNIDELIEQYHRCIRKNKLDALLVFNSDHHLNENIRECDKIVKILSGFSGSNGTLLFVKKSETIFEHFLFTDSRYTILAKEQSEIFKLNENQLMKVLKNCLVIGFNYKTISHQGYTKLEEELPQARFIDVDPLSK